MFILRIYLLKSKWDKYHFDEHTHIKSEIAGINLSLHSFLNFVFIAQYGENLKEGRQHSWD